MNNNSRINYIDGFKGIASFIVFTGHFLISFYPFFLSNNPNEVFFQNHNLIKYIVFSPISFFYNGHFAVMAFFVLSGYLLSYKYFVTGDKSIIVSGFFRRYLRLAIPIFFSCFLAYSCLKLNLFFNQETSLITHSKWLALFYNFKPNFIQMIKFSFYGVYFNFHGYQDYNNPLWVMQMVLFGSFLVFAFLLLFIYTKKRYIIYLISILLFHKTYYLAFILGIMLCDENTNNYNYQSFFKNKIILFSLFLMGICLGSFKFHNFWINRFLNNCLITVYFKGFSAILYHIIGSFFIIYVLINSKFMRLFFSSYIISYFGRISFPLYIIHFIIICSLSCFLFNGLYELTHLKTICFIVTWVVTFLVTILVSHLFCVSIEKRTIQLTRKLYNIIESYYRMNFIHLK